MRRAFVERGRWKTKILLACLHLLGTYTPIFHSVEDQRSIWIWDLGFSIYHKTLVTVPHGIPTRENIAVASLWHRGTKKGSVKHREYILSASLFTTEHPLGIRGWVCHGVLLRKVAIAEIRVSRVDSAPSQLLHGERDVGGMSRTSVINIV